jgi:hypothetical protein
MNTGTDLGAGPPRIFSSASELRRAFEHGLAGLLEQDVLGAFILVLANATFERETFARLQSDLPSRFGVCR